MVLSLVSGLHGCTPCERSGCDGVGRPATSGQVKRGIAGVVAIESDVINDGCQECPFGSAELAIWSTPTLIADIRSAHSVASGGNPAFKVAADHRYEQALEPGFYLVCKLPSVCAAVSIPQAGLVTVNVKQVYGPASLIVFEPGSGTQRTDGIFMVSTDR
jgi:hypothetical protein